MDSYDELRNTMGRLSSPLREIARRMGVSHGTLLRAEVCEFTPDQAARFEQAVREIGQELVSFTMPAHRILEPAAVELPDGTELARAKVTQQATLTLLRPSGES